MANEAGLTLSGHFQDHAVESHPERWNSLWKDHKFTPWDRGGPSLALLDVLQGRPDLLDLPSQTAKRSALVPGCGRGHDVLLLESLGYDAYGLEVSPSALIEARKNADSLAAGEVAGGQTGSCKGSHSWISGNFFEEAWTREARVQKFDLIFDYTFFCALPPSARPRWAKRMSELLAPSGRLVCLEFPSTKPSSEAGPPWAAPPHAYVAYLGRPGQEPVTDEDGGVVEANVEDPLDGGLRRILHEKPRRSHAAGMKDGEMVDCISVWKHLQNDCETD